MALGMYVCTTHRLCSQSADTISTPCAAKIIIYVQLWTSYRMQYRAIRWAPNFDVWFQFATN